MPVVEMMTEDEARALRAATLAEVGGDEAALRARAADYSLTAAERAALERIDDLDFLLGVSPE